MKDAALKTHSPSATNTKNGKKHNAETSPRDSTRGANPLWQKLALHSDGEINIGSGYGPCEQQADEIADKVSDNSLHAQLEGIPNKSSILAKANAKSGEPGSVTSSVKHVIESSEEGNPLNSSVRSRIEPVLGADLSSIRIHHSPASQAASKSINAQAFNYRNHIFLGQNQSPDDVSLIGHEATHATQHQSAGNIVWRKDLQVELNTELEAWAKGKGYSLDPNHKDYAFVLQEYAYGLARDGGNVDPTPKPKDPAEVKKWETNFKKISLLAKMIMNAGKVEQKETRAGMLGQDLAQVGFINEAMETAALFTKDEQKGYIYQNVLTNAAKAEKQHLVTITRFYTKGKTIGKNHVIDKLDDTEGAFAKSLGSEKLNAMLDILIDAYKKEGRLVTILSKILVFNTGLRKGFSDWMWTKDKDFLFKVVDSDYFVEPGYGGQAFADASGNAREMDMKKDMPWVYTVKQKYYVDFLVGLGQKASIALPKPSDLKFYTLRTWLDKHTEKIGEILKALYAKQPEEIAKVYEKIADIFFFHVDRGDVSPDLSGKLAKLGPSDPNKMRLKSDCDVLATYATRLLKSSGFTPIGYMAIIPDDTTGHAVALLQQGADYFIVNNKEVSKVSAKDKAEALKLLRNDAITVWDSMESYKVYYADAEANGAMPASLRDTEEGTRRKDLEPAPKAAP